MPFLWMLITISLTDHLFNSLRFLHKCTSFIFLLNNCFFHMTWFTHSFNHLALLYSCFLYLFFLFSLLLPPYKFSLCQQHNWLQLPNGNNYWLSLITQPFYSLPFCVSKGGTTLAIHELYMYSGCCFTVTT